jgi:hypothetical protein
MLLVFHILGSLFQFFNFLKLPHSEIFIQICVLIITIKSMFSPCYQCPLCCSICLELSNSKWSTSIICLWFTLNFNFYLMVLWLCCIKKSRQVSTDIWQWFLRLIYISVFVGGKRPVTVTSLGGAPTNSIVPVSVSGFCSQNDNRQYDCTLKYCWRDKIIENKNDLIKWRQTRG